MGLIIQTPNENSTDRKYEKYREFTVEVKA